MRMAAVDPCSRSALPVAALPVQVTVKLQPCRRAAGRTCGNIMLPVQLCPCILLCVAVCRGPALPSGVRRAGRANQV